MVIKKAAPAQLVEHVATVAAREALHEHLARFVAIGDREGRSEVAPTSSVTVDRASAQSAAAAERMNDLAGVQRTAPATT